MAIDLVRARRETPGCSRVAHFNNAGAALMPHVVVNAMTQHLQREALMGGYEAGDLAQEALVRFYDAAAALIGARPAEIAWAESATRAWDMAFYSIPFAPGDRVLTAAAEYDSNYLAFLHRAQATGLHVDVVPADEQGQISVEALQGMIDERVKLIALTHVPSNGGLVNPAAAVGQVARAAGVLYLLDAAQSIGQMPLDVQAIGCDFLVATGRKFLRGPRGTAFLYVREAVLDRLSPPFVSNLAATWGEDLHRFEWAPGARRFETWERSVTAQIGLGMAISYAMDWGLGAIEERVNALAERLRQRLSELPGVTVRDLGARRCGIVTCTLAGHDPADVKAALHGEGINVSVIQRNAARLDMEARRLDRLLRASVHYYNTDGEIDRLVTALERVARSR